MYQRLLLGSGALHAALFASLAYPVSTGLHRLSLEVGTHCRGVYWRDTLMCSFLTRTLELHRLLPHMHTFPRCSTHRHPTTRYGLMVTHTRVLQTGVVNLSLFVCLFVGVSQLLHRFSKDDLLDLQIHLTSHTPAWGAAGERSGGGGGATASVSSATAGASGKASTAPVQQVWLSPTAGAVSSRSGGSRPVGVAPAAAGKDDGVAVNASCPFCCLPVGMPNYEVFQCQAFHEVVTMGLRQFSREGGHGRL